MKIYTNADDLPKDIVEYIKSWSIMEWSSKRVKHIFFSIMGM